MRDELHARDLFAPRPLRSLRLRAGIAARAEGSCAPVSPRARISGVPLISYAQRLRNHAEADPGHLAVTDEWRAVNRRELEQLANRTARALEARGVHEADRVTIGLPNSIEFVATTIACWKIGATPQPVSSRLPQRELDAIIELAESRVVVLEPIDVDGFYVGPLADAIPHP